MSGKIPKGWKKVKLGEVAEIQNGYAFKSKDFKNIGKIPVIKIKNIASGKLDLSDLSFYQGSIDGLEKFIIRENDILIAMTGSHIYQPSSMVGKVIRYKNNKKALLNQRIGKIYSKNNELLNKDYLYYFLIQDNTTYTLALNASGSANQANISPNQIKSLEILLPPLPEQKAIAGVLSSLDDKIDLLHRQNKTLEQIAQTLFRKWFIEDAKEDWEEGVLPDEFDFIMGQSPPGNSYNEEKIGIPFFQGNADFGFRFPENRVYTTEPKRLAEKYDTLISVRAPVGAQNMAFEKCCIGRGIAAFRYKKNKTCYTYTYYKMKSLMDEIKQYNETGTVFGSITKGDFKTLEISIPPITRVLEFQKLVKPIDDKIIKNSIQIRTLEKLRDTLLPKLMSGKVRVTVEKEDKI